MTEMNSSEFPEVANQELEKGIQASTNAVYLLVMILALPFMYLLSWVPKIGVVGYWGFLVLLIALPIAAVIWWIKYRSVRSDDTNFKRAKLYPVVALALTGVMLIVWLVAPMLYISFRLSRLSASPSTLVIFEDVDGTIWAVHSSKMKKKNSDTITIEKYAAVAKDPGPDVTPQESAKYSTGSRAAFASSALSRYWLESEKYEPGTVYRGWIGEGSARVTIVFPDTEVKVKKIWGTSQVNIK